MLADDIVQYFEKLERHDIPAIDVSFPIDARMSVYRDDHDWAIVIELFEFNQQRLFHDGIITSVWTYGSCLPKLPGRRYPELHVTGDAPDAPLFNLRDFDNSIMSSASGMKIRSRLVPIPTRLADYQEAGIVLCEPPVIYGYELLRLITPEHRSLVFLSEEEMSSYVGRHLPLLLRLEEWYHPDEPGDFAKSEIVRILAQVISYGDASLYRPRLMANTHWRNWPMAGVV
ncbi:MAG: hypothetical protein AAGI46_13260 [Planctomycetota bacterium]